MPGAEIEQCMVFDQGPFGSACRTGSVDTVGNLRGGNRMLHGYLGYYGSFVHNPYFTHGRCLVIIEADFCTAVFEHVLLTISRVIRVNRQIDSSCFEDCHCSHDEVGRALHFYTYHCPLLQTCFDQLICKAVRKLVKLLVAEFSILIYYCCTSREAVDCSCNMLMHIAFEACFVLWIEGIQVLALRCINQFDPVYSFLRL